MMWDSYFDAQLGILSISEVGCNAYRMNFFVYNWTDYNCPPDAQLARIWKFVFQHCEFSDVDDIESYLRDHKSYTKALKSFERYKERSYR